MEIVALAEGTGTDPVKETLQSCSRMGEEESGIPRLSAVHE